ncbi:hypothetical protein [Tamlana crocina]|uniref:PH domain-containing protein n=1 Tax=Tamlana crocina TaxID=393006 RepID=A0ABX1DAJ1_9FLAO|nr:hypothetical protein [Tamlana crocina]NJX15371.1 hypothetical protein [Tamlana crocina]
MIKIKYKKKRLYSNLVIGVVWLVFAVFHLANEEKIDWTDYGYCGISLMYLLQFIYEYVNQYLTINNNVIKKHGIFGKALKFSEVENFKIFAGEYILQTQSAELRIDTNVIENTSLTRLNKIIEKHELPGAHFK